MCVSNLNPECCDPYFLSLFFIWLIHAYIRSMALKQEFIGYYVDPELKSQHGVRHRRLTDQDRGVQLATERENSTRRAKPHPESLRFLCARNSGSMVGRPSE